MKVINPGATIGVLGGGQLGRMLAYAAKELGYKIHVYCPENNSVAAEVADFHTCAKYDDKSALEKFAKSTEVVTFEFENIPANTAESLSLHVPVRPNGRVLHAAQNRVREKTTIKAFGIQVTPFFAVESFEQAKKVFLNFPNGAILKSARFGYDGKGQSVVSSLEELAKAWEEVGEGEKILEQRIDLKGELSIVIARGIDGSKICYGPFENVHKDGILDSTCYPSSYSQEVCLKSSEVAKTIADSFDYVGVLCVEFFLDQNDNLFVNEIAPRPHNSGHLTIDAFMFSQYHQQVRAICGLPLGSNQNLKAAAMVNLLGELWEGGEPNWSGLGEYPNARLHLYGKSEARPGRKMGHITVCADSAQSALETALKSRSALKSH